MIYLVKILNSDIGKIGYTKTNPKNRLSNLQTGNDKLLEMVYLIHGEKILETELHEKFKQYRLKGEWFELNPDIINFFESYENLIDRYNLNSNHTNISNNTGIFIQKYCSDIEIAAIFRLILNLNSDNTINLINPNSTIKDLMDFFKISKNLVNPLIKKFESIGLIKNYKNKWYYNPFMVHKTKKITSFLQNLFSNTHINKSHENKDYTLDEKTIKELKLKTPKIKK